MTFAKLHVLARYIAAGSIAVAVHYLVLVLLVEGSAIDPTLASSSGFAVGVVVNYYIQYHWTFRSTGPHGKRFPIFVAAALAMLGLNAVLFWGLHEHAGMNYLVAQAVAILAVFSVNFVINSRYTFAPDDGSI
jgi:putative flippase GtrA